MKEKFYKVVCPEINSVILVKKIPIVEEKRYFAEIRAKVRNATESFTILSFQKLILEKYVHNFKELSNQFIVKDEEDVAIVISSMYAAVVDCYPPLDLMFICNQINTTSFMSDIETHMDKLLGKKKGDKDKSNHEDSKNISTLKDIKALEKYLTKNIIGQEEAVQSIVENIKLLTSGLYHNASFFFVGPTGVGKTQLAKLLGESYSGNFWKINCAEYANAHEYAKLIGSPPGYVGHSESCLIHEKSQISNKWVILFDEIEKAHHKLYDFLLSLLDDGTCTDNLGRVIDFSESIFIFTSNQGVSDVKVGRKVGFHKEEVSVSGSKEEITTSVKNKFPAEFMNRIDNYIFFNQLSKDNVRKIASLALNGLPIKKHKVLLDFIVENGFSSEYGARNINRFIKNNVATAIAQALLESKLPSKKGDLYTPKIVDNTLVLDSSKFLQSDHAVG